MITDTAKRGNGTVWAWTSEGIVLTASPSIVCVWASQSSVNTTEGLVAGPFAPDPRVRSEADLRAFYEQWLTEGAPS